MFVAFLKNRFFLYHMIVRFFILVRQFCFLTGSRDSSTYHFSWETSALIINSQFPANFLKDIPKSLLISIKPAFFKTVIFLPISGYFPFTGVFNHRWLENHRWFSNHRWFFNHRSPKSWPLISITAATGELQSPHSPTVGCWIVFKTNLLALDVQNYHWMGSTPWKNPAYMCYICTAYMHLYMLFI